MPGHLIFSEQGSNVLPGKMLKKVIFSMLLIQIRREVTNFATSQNEVIGLGSIIGGDRI